MPLRSGTWTNRRPLCRRVEPVTALLGRKVEIAVGEGGLLPRAAPPAARAALLLLAAIYMKYNAAFVIPALVAAFIVAKGKAALRDWHAFLAARLVVIGLLPAAFILLKIGARNLQSVSGIQGVPPLGSLDCWLFYIKSLPDPLGDLTVCLAVGGLALIMWRFVRGQDRWLYGLLLSWLTVGYLAFTLISLEENAPHDHGADAAGHGPLQRRH
jgi:hypothetical protein